MNVTELTKEEYAKEREELCKLLCKDYAEGGCEHCGSWGFCWVLKGASKLLDIGYRNQKDIARRVLSIVTNLRNEVESEQEEREEKGDTTEESFLMYTGSTGILSTLFLQIEHAFGVSDVDVNNRMVFDTKFGEMFDIVNGGIKDKRGPFIRLHSNILDKQGNLIPLSEVDTRLVETCKDELGPSYKQLMLFRQYIEEDEDK